VIVEPGSDLVAELWGTPLRAASSILCYPEGRAASQRAPVFGPDQAGVSTIA
jgi:hypothetical protein